MAIQDDNTILNKGDLKAYHEAIAPLLGGTFMVRTNNSDFYSTDEKVVGVWTNGKPLYQKTLQGVFPTVTAQVNETFNLSIGASVEFGFVVAAFLVDRGSVIQDTPIIYLSDNELSAVSLQTWVRTNTTATNPNTVGVRGGREYYSNLPVIVTIQYTKTTDTAGSATTTPGAYDINFPNTWPENTEIYFGNGLYGKRATGTITAAAATAVSTSLSTFGTAKLVSFGGQLEYSNTGDSIQLGYQQGDNNYIAALYREAVNGEVFLYNKTSMVRTNAPYDVWFTYCK